MSWEITFITNETHLHNGKAQLKFWVKMDLDLRHCARYIKAHICRVQLTCPLRSEHSETQDKQVKAENSQNNTENNIVNKIELPSDEEDDNESDLQMHDTAVRNRKNHPYPTLVMKPNEIIKFKDSYDVECIGRVISCEEKPLANTSPVTILNIKAH